MTVLEGVAAGLLCLLGLMVLTICLMAVVAGVLILYLEAPLFGLVMITFMVGGGIYGYISSSR